ncbi:MAG TPA: hypothetical protein VFU92_00540 [Usitatibacter sp.]|nr:hypothetical protein [Usitatibacter sp.]
MPLWFDRIAAAETPEALVAFVREHLASIPPDEFAGVPAWIGSMRVKGLDDLAYWQKKLAEEYCDGGALRDAEAVMVTQLLAFFTAACERTNHLRVTDEGARALFSEKSIPKLFREQSPPL